MRLTIPDDVRRFILASVPSVPYMEALLLLRAEPGAQWDADKVATRLYVPQQQAEELLRQLAEAGLASQGPEARFAWKPAPEMEGIISEVVRLYAEDLVGVTELIHARQERRARQFADAFRWRKKEE